jgi:hypothetical protein
MKKLIAFTILLFCVQDSFAQNDEAANGQLFKKFKVDVSLGFAIPQGSGTKGGLIFVIEPKYAVMEQLAVGLRLEGAALANVDINGEKGDIRILASYLATGDYYFNNNKFRPFAGVGGGIFTMASFKIEDTNTEIPSSSDFGFMARAGFEYGHFRLGVEYNFLKDNAGYFGIKLGACIGGGRK